MRKTVASFLASLLFVGLVSAEEKIMVAAAANVSAVAADLGAAFSAKYPGYRAEFTFGASGALVTQMLNGSPAEVLLSADTAFPQKLVDAGAAAGPVKVYAFGSLILLSTKKLDFSKGLAVLAEPSVVQFANSNPETAPYGRAAEEALKKASLFDSVKAKLVTAQNVTQALQFTLSGADAGFVNKSALRSKDVLPYDNEGVNWIEIDPRLYSPIAQGFVVTKSALARPAVAAFADFLLSPEAKAVFLSFGYAAP